MPLPNIPESATKTSIINNVKEYAMQNCFEVVIVRSSETSVHLRCKKGGQYRNTRNLTEEERKSWKNSCKTECPFMIRIGKEKKGGKVTYLPPTSENELYHNHELDYKNLLSTSAGRKRMLDSDDIVELQRGIEQNIPSKMIQKVLSSESSYNKLTVHDINNLKYTMINRADVRSDDGATKLIRHIGNSGFIVEYRCDPISENLDGLFFSNPSLLDRARRFPEVILIDATYNTNDLKMPLISMFGVSNVGKETLKTFPIAFAYVSSEKEEMYEWFFMTFKEIIGRCLRETIFVTDKCTALTNQLDNQFPENKKLLCT